MNIIFFGSPSYSCDVLKFLHSGKHNVSAIVTQDLKNNKSKNTAVGNYGEQAMINTLYPSDLNDENFLNILNKINADLYIIYAYGKMLPSNIISLPKYGVINIHCSLLPKWRGAAPIQRALMNNDRKTGVTMFRVNDNLDTGEIISTYEYDIINDDNTLSLQAKLTDLAISKLDEVISINNSSKLLVRQNEMDASYAKKIKKSESIINWNEGVQNISSTVRALVGWPVAECEIFGVNFKIWKARYCIKDVDLTPGSLYSFDRKSLGITANDGIVQIEKLQFPGKRIVTAGDLFNSNTEFVTKIKSYLHK